MILEPAAISGMLVGRPVVHRDPRGEFARLFDLEALAAAGFRCEALVCATASNTSAGTLRGLHYQADPAPERKLVTCLRGRVLDVIVDLRISSPSYRAHVAVELAGESPLVVAIPSGCAHGYLTLTDDTLLLYQISGAYREDLQRGVRWDDPGLGMTWPRDPEVISDRDRAFPNHTW